MGPDTLGVPPVHQHLEWYSKYGSSCLALVQVTKLPACNSHLNASKDILKISRLIPPSYIEFIIIKVTASADLASDYK